MNRLPLEIAPSKLAEPTAHLTEEQQKQISYQSIKQLPMQGFMMWMMGSTLNIFTIGFLSMNVINSIKGLKSIILLDSFHKILFIVAQLPMLALILWKLNQLQLFQSDIKFENDFRGLEFID
eukprot:NODE_162_length_16547_cov_0.334326.p11 type:complete len:122 gc:universal NODE_162_length_16547_cov_0.334326:2122-2487(+)